jgi:hypothetical protein
LQGEQCELVVEDRVIRLHSGKDAPSFKLARSKDWIHLGLVHADNSLTFYVNGKPAAEQPFLLPKFTISMIGNSSDL